MPDDAVQARERFEKQVLDEAPRLCREDSFRFACHPGVSCFGDCCGDVNIVLTPYDVLRLKNRLGMGSKEFLDTHTVLPFCKEQRLPAPLIKMRDDERKSCPFNAEGACTVYEDRPWACRMYPLGYASPGEGDSAERAFWFLMEEDHCRGFEESRTQTVAEWIAEQGVEEYDVWGERYRKLAVDEFLAKGRELDPQKMQMFFMGTYELDTFRRFVFESTFLDRFDVPEAEVERMRSDDEALLAFAFRWLLMSLFGKATMKLKEKPAERES